MSENPVVRLQRGHRRQLHRSPEHERGSSWRTHRDPLRASLCFLVAVCLPRRCLGRSVALYRRRTMSKGECYTSRVENLLHRFSDRRDRCQLSKCLKRLNPGGSPIFDGGCVSPGASPSRSLSPREPLEFAACHGNHESYRELDARRGSRGVRSERDAVASVQ